MNDQGPIQMTPQQRQAIAKAKARLRLQQQGQPQPAAPVQQSPARMDDQTSRSVLLANGIDPSAVKNWYNGAESRDGPGAQIPSWKTAPASDPTKPTPPPALWEAPVNVAKAVDTPDEARARALVGRRIDGVGPRTPDPTQAPISEQQLSSQTYWNAEKPPEPMTNPIKRAAIGVTNILSDTGNMIMEGAEAIQAPRTYDPKDPMSRRMQGAPPPPVKPGPRIPMIYKPEAQNFEQAAADVTGIIGGLALPLGPVSNTFRAGGQALRSTNTIGRAAAAITPQGTSALDRTIRLGGRTAAMTPEAAATAFGAGAILGGENMGGDGDRLKAGVEFASAPENLLFQPAAMLLNRAAIFIKTAGKRVTPEVVQVQRAEEVLRRANASAAEQAAAARVIDELTPPDPQAGSPQATAQPTAQAAPQPSVAPVVPPNVAQGAPRAAQAGPAGAGQQAGAGAAQPVLNATQVAPPVGPPGYTVTMAKSDAKIIGRILQDAGIPRNDVKPLLADTVTAYQRFVSQAHQSGEKVRLNLTFFAEDYLGQRLSAELAKNVQVKLRAFGNAANNSGDLAKAPVQRAAEELRGSQETYLTDIFERELGDESLRTTKNKIRGDKQLNAQAVYKTELTKGQKVIKEGKGTKVQSEAFDKLLGKMRQDEFFAKIPYELKVKAGNDPDVNGDLSEYVIDHPLEAAHWLQSNLGVLARKGGENAGAYREMRMALLRPLEDAVPGYRGARKRAGDLVGQEIAVNFGDDLFRFGRTEVQTADMADDFKRLSPAQKVVAERSIRDKLKNEFRASKEDAIDPVTGERVDSRGAMLTNLQKAGTLDALEQILGAKGKRIADGIRNIMRENPRIPAYGSDSAKNIAERRAIEDAMRSPVNKAIGAAGDKTGWVVPLVADAAMGTFPLATGARIGGEILERFGQPSRKQIASAANTLYALPPTPATRPGAPPPPTSGNRRPPPPRTGPRPPVTEADIETMRRRYDALDHGKAPKTSEQLARQIVNAEKRLAAQLASPSAPKPRRVKAATPAAAPTTAPTTPAQAKPPLPGQTSQSSPMAGGAALGALISGGGTYAATGDEDAALKAGILGGIGGGVVGSRFGKGAKPKAPPSAPRSGPPGVKPPPVKPANDTLPKGQTTPREDLSRATKFSADGLDRQELYTWKQLVSSTTDPAELRDLLGVDLSNAALRTDRGRQMLDRTKQEVVRSIGRAVNDLQDGVRPNKPAPPGVKPPPVRGADQAGFGSGKAESRPKPPPKGQKAPPKGPGTLSRMVAGGAVGGLAGSAGTAEPQTPETAQKIADNDRLIERELGQIADFESALKIFSDGTPEEIQAQLDSEGFDLGPTGIDGTLGDITKAAIRGRKEELNVNLKTARERLATLEGERDKLKADAAFERTRPTEEQLAFRDYAPLLGGIAGATGAKLLRVGGTTVSKFTAKNAIKKADALLNNAPISPPKTVQDRAEIRKRATNVNEFWQRGGSKTKVPFETKRDGTWIARPPKDVMPPSALFPDRFIGRKVGAMDALIGGSAATEAVLAGQNAELIKEKLATAYENLKDDKSEENYARVQELEDQYAQAKGLMMLGIGAGIGTGIGVMTSKYASKRANVPKAEEELAILRDYFANQKKPPPKATAKAKKAPPKPPLPPSRPRRNQRPPKP